MKFLIINGKLQKGGNGKFVTIPDDYNNEPLKLNGNVLMIGGKVIGNNPKGESVLPKLATPQNVSADGTTVSFDEVENATSYAVLADGSEIGTVENGPTGGTLTIHFIDDGGVNGQVIINNGSPQTITGTQTKVYEGVLTFEVRSMLACDITNQTGSMVGVTEHYTQYEINGDGSATIQFYD